MSGTDKDRKKSSGTAKYALILAAMCAALVMALSSCDSREAEKIDLSERIDDAELAKMAPERDGGGHHLSTVSAPFLCAQRTGPSPRVEFSGVAAVAAYAR